MLKYLLDISRLGLRLYTRRSTPDTGDGDQDDSGDQTLPQLAKRPRDQLRSCEVQAPYVVSAGQFIGV